MTNYSDTDKASLSEAILKEMETTSCSKACKVAGVPISTFMGWLDENKILAEQYTRARTLYPDNLIEEAMELADEDVPTDDRGRTDAGLVQKRREQINLRKWIAARMKPKKWGDRLTLAGDEEQPLTVVKIERTVVDPRKNGEEDGK